MQTILLCSTCRYGKNGDTIEVDDDVAIMLLCQGMANHIPVVAPKSKRQPVNRMEPGPDPDTIKKRGTKDAVIIKP